MTTQVVGLAWSQFYKDKESMIQKAFRDVGVTLPVDGSRDHELQIKGFAAKDLKTEQVLIVILVTLTRYLRSRQIHCFWDEGFQCQGYNFTIYTTALANNSIISQRYSHTATATTVTIEIQKYRNIACKFFL